MARRAWSGPGNGKRALMMAAGLAGVLALLGCGGGGGDNGGGGGGGGGGTLGPCGSAAGSTTPVVCGKVMADLTTSPAAGVEVILRNNAGAEIGRTTSAADGSFVFRPATGGTQLEVAPPSSLYATSMARFLSKIYDFDLPNQAGTGKCYIATGVTAGDTNIGTVFVFPNSSPPPPPMGGCPR